MLQQGESLALRWCRLRRTGQEPPADRAAVVRCVLESLAPAHRAALRRAAELSGHPVEVVHLVGSGSKNALLCQFTAVGRDAWAEASALLNSHRS
ncbi:FGGY-family carbohydrate kinase [Nonomuraea sp. CA-141351]|uniref:FGGY-family carbohydrate kinase n=1 Tax=Nonomuraea sp. CA-141351 TaxID=3239996 RepID=UPI003D8E805A